VVHTPELQAYTASRLYNALREDISQEALTLSATWILGEYSETLIEGGLVDEELAKTVWSTMRLSTLSNTGIGNRCRDHRSHPLHSRFTVCQPTHAAIRVRIDHEDFFAAYYQQ
jgi:hypothetical protein